MLFSPDGTVTFLCPRVRLAVCHRCGRKGDYACDYPVDEWGNTCDVDMCRDCANSVGWNRHYCNAHMEIAMG